VRKLTKDFDWGSNTATHDTTRGTTDQHRTHGDTDEGTSRKFNLRKETAVSATTLETPEDDQCWSKHVVCIYQ
jgi:hypothetical protein